MTNYHHPDSSFAEHDIDYLAHEKIAHDIFSFRPLPEETKNHPRHHIDRHANERRAQVEPTITNLGQKLAYVLKAAGHRGQEAQPEEIGPMLITEPLDYLLRKMRSNILGTNEDPTTHELAPHATEDKDHSRAAEQSYPQGVTTKQAEMLAYLDEIALVMHTVTRAKVKRLDPRIEERNRNVEADWQAYLREEAAAKAAKSTEMQVA